MRPLIFVALALVVSACDTAQLDTVPVADMRCPATVPGEFKGEATDPYRIEHLAVVGHAGGHGTMSLSTGDHYSLTVDGVACLSFYAVAYHEGTLETVFASLTGEYTLIDGAWSLYLTIEHVHDSTQDHATTLWMMHNADVEL